MSGEISSKLFEKLKVYKNYSNDCIFFKYVFDESDLPDDESKNAVVGSNVFKPEYTHQIFGDEEIIFGYKNLRIDYLLTPGNLDAYIGLSYKEKISPQKFDGIEPDDVYHAFSEFGCSPGFTKNLNVFRSEKLTKDLEFLPFGTKIYEYTHESVKNESKYTGHYEIYKVDSSLPEFESPKFIDYLTRVQTMLVYYIETSNFLDTEDPQWTHFLLYEKIKHQSSISSNNSNYRYATIGYLSLYNYYAYPDKTRSRISQILIFPNYQHGGHGAELIESVYRDALHNPEIIDVTAESPSPEFIRVRDYVTTKMCLTLDTFKNKDALKKGFTNEIMLDALKKLKLPKLQSRRCYEILRLLATNQNIQDEWTTYRLELKKRFYLPFIRKSKYARNNNNSSPNGENQQEKEVKVDPKKSTLESRFGGGGASSSKFETIEEETTIGFGSNAKKAPSNTTMFINTGGSSNRFTNGKSAIKTVKFTSMNTSNSTTDSNASDEEENDENQGLSSANLFVSDQERKKYLEEQFQECISDYYRTIKRLEHANLI